MKTLKLKLSELRKEFLKRIADNDYKVIESRIESDGYLRLNFTIDSVLFEIGVPPKKTHITQYHTGSNISLFISVGSSLDKKFANMLFKRHGEPIKKKSIEAQIKNLQAQLS